MAKYTALLAMFCILLSIAGSVQGKEDEKAKGGDAETFHVKGKIYCDPCRIEFPTRISYGLANTKVKLTCRDRTTEKVTYEVEGVTDNEGIYHLTTNGDHEEEICDVRPLASPEPKCADVMKDDPVATVSLTNKNGVKGDERFANPIGYIAKEADPRCPEILTELGYIGIDEDDDTKSTSS